MQEFSLVAASVTAVLAGLLSFLSPCVLPLMPAYLSFVSGLSMQQLRSREDEPERSIERRVLLGSLAFIAGFSGVFIALGASATAVGRALGELTRWHLTVAGWRFGLVNLVVGAVIVLLGLHLMGALRISFLYREQRFQAGAGGGAARAMLLGAAFAFGWTPCIGPVLAGILTVAAGQETVGRGVLLLALYSLGLGIPFLLMALSLDRFYSIFERLKRHFRAVEVSAGLLVVAVGLAVMTDMLTAANSYFAFMNDFVLWLEEALL